MLSFYNSVANCCSAESTEVFVFVALGQHQQKPFSDGCGPIAFWAVQLYCLKLLKLFLIGSTRSSCHAKFAISDLAHCVSSWVSVEPLSWHPWSRPTTMSN